VPNLFRETSVDGLIINLLPVFSEDLVEYFETQPLPCVWLNLKRSYRSVYPDEASGAALAVNNLLSKGRRRIGYFSRLSAPATHFSALDRFAGYCSALKTARLSPHRHLELISSSWEATQAIKLLERAHLFLKSFPDVEAVVCYEYEEAICLALAAERLGIRTPENLDIIGFHEREIRSHSCVPIPTAIIPFRQVGAQAVEMLWQMINSKVMEAPSVAVPYTSILV
jgi:DNA-binding LacI/PurR family transcriptional regulator